MTSIFLYGNIGEDASVQDLSDYLSQANGQDVNLHVFSYGGDAGQGMAMYNLLQNYPGKVNAYIDGIAASAGTLPIMAANRVYMPSNALIMIHDCHAVASGNAASFRAKADQLDKFSDSYLNAYVKRTGKDTEMVSQWMSKNNGRGTFFTARQAFDAGFIDEITGPASIKAQMPECDQNRFSGIEDLPEELKFWMCATVESVDPLAALAMPPTEDLAETATLAPVEARLPVATEPIPHAAAALGVDPEVSRLKRENEIRTAAAHASLSPDQVQALVDSGKPMAEVAIDIIKAATADSEKVAAKAGHPARLTVVADAGDTLKDAIQARIEHRLKPGSVLPEIGRRFRGSTMLDLVRASMEMNGINPVGRSKTELAVYAFHSTSDIPLLLENAANKTLMPAYEEEPHTWAPIATQKNLPDFKDSRSYSIAADLIPKELKEGGEYESATITEGRASWRLYTYARKILYTREMIINDDLSALEETLPLFGRGFRRFESNMIWNLIVNNANSAEDGLPLFDASHNNTGTGAITIPAISAGRKAMGTQKDLAGTAINLEPGFLVGPRDLEDEILQFLYPTGYAPSALTGASGVHPYVGKMEPIIESRLNGSATQWYLVAPKSRITGLMYGYLEDEPGPNVTSETLRDPDGVKIMARIDFGCAIRDHRAFYRSSGV